MKMSQKTWKTLNYTWGILITFAGLIVAQALKLLGYQSKTNIWGIYFEVGENWGGFNMGPVTVVSKNPTQHTLNHEFGHSVQNALLGPLMLILVVIPSVARYWYREYLIRSGKKSYFDLPDYDSAWFEGTATKLGNLYYEEINK